MLKLLRDVNFFEILEACDRELARKVQEAPCPRCGGPMHVANFRRKERGPAAAQNLPLSGIRLSYCCGGDCRKRVTPESVRFLGRRVYLEVVFVLACVRCALALAFEAAAWPAPTPAPALAPTGWLPVKRTLSRWKKWWAKDFTLTGVWQALLGRLLPPVEPATLPGGLLNRLSGNPQERLLRLLKLLMPLSTAAPQAAPA